MIAKVSLLFLLTVLIVSCGKDSEEFPTNEVKKSAAIQGAEEVERFRKELLNSDIEEKWTQAFVYYDLTYSIYATASYRFESDFVEYEMHRARDLEMKNVVDGTAIKLFYKIKKHPTEKGVFVLDFVPEKGVFRKLVKGSWEKVEPKAETPEWQVMIDLQEPFKTVPVRIIKGKLYFGSSAFLFADYFIKTK